ncbi:hypothetical protein [Emcibacter nanhaiensis]|uniref:Uncharacterized protein n=1 Tax=Emcibacter nanhaiensis TaxID=1505037 RepID=A0A501PRZ1_9PROT|nr:hypothetical protein [Emcibacter nanhaiensis]TPD63005.1 hypothetical protein FIV46_02695 [Emcibacter nanhaiensis]
MRPEFINEMMDNVMEMSNKDLLLFLRGVAATLSPEDGPGTMAVKRLATIVADRLSSVCEHLSSAEYRIGELTSKNLALTAEIDELRHPDDQ